MSWKVNGCKPLLPGCRRVMMTGRRSKLAPQVQHIMQNLDIACDEYIFNHTAHDTFTYKCKELRRLVAAHPGCGRSDVTLNP